jgi:hypothetical protein
MEDKLDAPKMKSAKSNYWAVLILDPPQNMTVAVQLFDGVRGNMTVPALAGYILTASGISCNGYSF